MVPITNLSEIIKQGDNLICPIYPDYKDLDLIKEWQYYNLYKNKEYKNKFKEEDASLFESFFSTYKAKGLEVRLIFMAFYYRTLFLANSNWRKLSGELNNSAGIKSIKDDYDTEAFFAIEAALKGIKIWKIYDDKYKFFGYYFYFLLNLKNEFRGKVIEAYHSEKSLNKTIDSSESNTTVLQDRIADTKVYDYKDKESLLVKYVDSYLTSGLDKYLYNHIILGDLDNKSYKNFMLANLASLLNVPLKNLKEYLETFKLKVATIVYTYKKDTYIEEDNKKMMMINDRFYKKVSLRSVESFLKSLKEN